MKHTLILFLLTLSLTILAQPRTVNAPSEKELSHAEKVLRRANTGEPYDVRYNCLNKDNFYSYIGQNFFLPPSNKKNYYCFKETSIKGQTDGVTRQNTGDYAQQLGYWGTPSGSVTNRVFHVDNIEQSDGEPDYFIFFLHDIYTGERLNYVYNIGTMWHSAPHAPFLDDRLCFPFLVQKHCEYLIDKYEGQQIVVADSNYIEPDDYRHILEHKDINTQEKLSFPSTICNTFLVKEIIWNKDHQELCFLLSDGEHEFISPINATYNEPGYSHGVGKKFLKQDWDRLVAHYGQEYMDAVMCSRVIKGMDTTLVKMSLGQPAEIRKEEDGFAWLYIHADLLVEFNNKGEVRKLDYGRASDEMWAKLAFLAFGYGSYKVIGLAGRIISAPFKIAHKLISFFGL